MGWYRQLSRLQFETLLLSAALVVFSIIVAAKMNPITSDDVAQQNAIATLAAGHHVAIDVPQNTYVIKYPFYALISLLPVRPSLDFILAACVLVLGMIALFYWAVHWLVGARSRDWYLVAVPLVWLASLNGAFILAIMNPNSRNIEIGFAFVAFALLAAWYRRALILSGKRGPVALGGLVVGLGLLFYDDPYFVYVVAAPLVLFFGAKWLFWGKDRNALVVGVAALASVAVARAWYALFWLLGIHAGGGSAYFASLAQVGPNAGLFVSGALNFYRAGFFGQPVFSLLSLGLVLNFLLLVLTLLSPILLLWPRVRRDVWATFFVLQPPFVSAVFIFSSLAINLASDRYLVILPFYTVLTLALLLVRVLNPRGRMVAMGVLLLCACLNMAAAVKTYLVSGSNPNADHQAEVRMVESLHLTKGYAGYRDAGVDEYLARNKVEFIQSGCSREAGVQLDPYLVNQQVWQRPATRSFYLYDPGATKCSEADLARFFGNPDQIVDLDDGKRLLVYGYDLATKIAAPRGI